MQRAEQQAEQQAELRAPPVQTVENQAELAMTEEPKARPGPATTACPEMKNHHGCHRQECIRTEWRWPTKEIHHGQHHERRATRGLPCVQGSAIRTPATTNRLSNPAALISSRRKERGSRRKRWKASRASRKIRLRRRRGRAGLRMRHPSVRRAQRSSGRAAIDDLHLPMDHRYLHLQSRNFSGQSSAQAGDSVRQIFNFVWSLESKGHEIDAGNEFWVYRCLVQASTAPGIGSMTNNPFLYFLPSTVYIQPFYKSQIK